MTPNLIITLSCITAALIFAVWLINVKRIGDKNTVSLCVVGVCCFLLPAVAFAGIDSNEIKTATISALTCTIGYFARAFQESGKKDT